MKYEVIDNFLDEEYFDSLVTLFIDKGKNNKGDGSQFTMPWFFDSSIAYRGLVEDKLFYMAHLFYDENIPNIEHYESLFPLLEKLKVNCLIRIKANLFPNTEILHEHPMHWDYPYSHSGAILSLNTCDGYTKLEDGTKINSVANRILLFDASKKHCSTTTTNAKARFNINLNYF